MALAHDSERSEPGQEEAAAPKALNRGNLAVLPERSLQPTAVGVGPRGTHRGARGASRAKSEASI